MKRKSHKIYVAFSAKIMAAGRDQAGSAVIKTAFKFMCVCCPGSRAAVYIWAYRDFI